MSEVVRPTSVKVGHMTYGIKWVSEKKYMKKHGTDSGGMTVSLTNTIYIRLGEDGLMASEDRLREVLCHEILHTCWHMGSMAEYAGKVDEDELEEWNVANLAPHLMTVFSNNPHIVEYLWPGILPSREGT